MNWLLKNFTELTTNELYAIMRLRSEVFVVEQDCVYLDPDGKDLVALHVMGIENDALVAYTRILPPGISYDEASIGRVVTAAAARRKGFGRELMIQTLAYTKELFEGSSIRISAQVYLKDFYTSLGFKIEGDEYLEDGIPHVEMSYEL